MALITWDNSLSVSIAEIDAQHQKLVGLVNEMHEAMRTGKSAEVMGKVLNEVVEYTKMHFATEERLMTKHNYPDYAKHKAMHDDLTKKAVDLRTQFTQNKSVVSMEVMKFLKDWLTGHIMGTDKAYTPFLKSKGVS